MKEETITAPELTENAITLKPSRSGGCTHAVDGI